MIEFVFNAICRFNTFATIHIFVILRLIFEMQRFGVTWYVASE